MITGDLFAAIICFAGTGFALTMFGFIAYSEKYLECIPLLFMAVAWIFVGYEHLIKWSEAVCHQ